MLHVSQQGVVPTRRERTRAATIEEIKGTARQLMRDTGTTDVRFSDVARTMGLTAPALYRYFADSEALLTELIVDAFDTLGDTVGAARERVPSDDLWGRLLAVCGAYRDWARHEPQQFALILGMPVPGYAACEDGATTQAAQRAMGQLERHFVDAARRGVLGSPLSTEVEDAYVAELAAVHDPKAPMRPAGAEDLAPDDPVVLAVCRPATHQAMLGLWASLHGFTSLEAYGHLDWLGPAARDALFVSVVRVAALTAGLPAR